MICRSNQKKLHFTACRRNKKLLYAVFFVLGFCFFASNAQNTLTNRQNTAFNYQNNGTDLHLTDKILQSPTVNSTYAGLTLISQSIIFKKYDVNVRDMRIRYMNNFAYDYDTYLQFVPIGLTFALKSFGLQTASTWSQLTASALLSYGLGYGFAKLIKENVSELRPDWGGYKSFPSGHTTVAFIGATVLSKEFKENYPYLSVAGYTTAALTGLSRVANNRHWMHDVLFGAGLGILATELSYALTDLVFQRSGGNATAFYCNESADEKPHFADFFFSYNINRFGKAKKLKNNTDYSVKNGIGIGIEAAYYFNRYIGVSVRAKADGYVVDNANIWWPEDSVLTVKSGEAGIVINYPLVCGIDAGLRAAAGLNHVDKNQLQDDVPIKSQNTLQLSGGMFLNLRMQRHTYLRFFADYTRTSLEIEDKTQKFPYFSLGAAIALHF